MNDTIDYILVFCAVVATIAMFAALLNPYVIAEGGLFPVGLILWLCGMIIGITWLRTKS